ncbi:MAG: hypothetical protein V4463_12565 [Pseudomonadota bacterium]
MIGGALLATLVACYFAPDEESGVIAPAQARTHSLPPVPVASTEPALDIHRRAEDDELGNAFAKQSWQPEAAKKVMLAQVEAAPAKRAAAPPGPPPLAIRFLGRFVEDGKTDYFLQLGERNIVAHPGDRIDDYTFDSANGDALNFTYQPLQLKQVLAVGDTN